MPNCSQIYARYNPAGERLTQLTLLGVAQLEVLILELVAVDRLAASAWMILVSYN
jgi:hypothetical protein